VARRQGHTGRKGHVDVLEALQRGGIPTLAAAVIHEVTVADQDRPGKTKINFGQCVTFNRDISSDSNALRARLIAAYGAALGRPRKGKKYPVITKEEWFRDRYNGIAREIRTFGRVVDIGEERIQAIADAVVASLEAAVAARDSLLTEDGIIAPPKGQLPKPADG